MAAIRVPNQVPCVPAATAPKAWPGPTLRLDVNSSDEGAISAPYPTPSNRYPSPRTVVIHDGPPGASSLLRRRRM